MILHTRIISKFCWKKYLSPEITAEQYFKRITLSFLPVSRLFSLFIFRSLSRLVRVRRGGWRGKRVACSYRRSMHEKRKKEEKKKDQIRILLGWKGGRDINPRLAIRATSVSFSLLVPILKPPPISRRRVGTPVEPPPRSSLLVLELRHFSRFVIGFNGGCWPAGSPHVGLFRCR